MAPLYLWTADWEWATDRNRDCGKTKIVFDMGMTSMYLTVPQASGGSPFLSPPGLGVGVV